MKLYNCYGRLVRPIADIENDLVRAKQLSDTHFYACAQAKFYGLTVGQTKTDAIIREFETELQVAEAILQARQASAVTWDSVLKVKVDNSALIEDVSYSKEE